MTLRIPLPPQGLYSLTNRHGRPVSQQAPRDGQTMRELETQHNPAYTAPSSCPRDYIERHQDESSHQEHADHGSNEPTDMQSGGIPCTTSPQPGDTIKAQCQ